MTKPAWIIEDIPAGERCSALDDEAQSLAGSIDGTVAHLRELEEATEGAPKPRHVAERIARLSAELDTLQAQLDAVEERRRIVDGGLVRERAYTLASAIRDHEGGPLEPVNAALRVLFDAVTVDYPRDQLVFHWRQGGTTAIPYGSMFGSSTRDAERIAA